VRQLPRIVLKGDRQAAEEMIREGVRQFDILLQQMKFAGLEQDVRRVRYLDGSEIVCKSVFGDNTLEIYVPPEVEEREEVLPPPEGDFIVKYDGEGYLMSVEGHRIEMTHVRGAEFPTVESYNTSIALTDRVIDIATATIAKESMAIFECITARCGKKKVGLETSMGLLLDFTESPYAQASYAIKELDEWDTIYVATVHYWKSGLPVPDWAGDTPFFSGWAGDYFVIEAKEYVWDGGEYKLRNNLRKNVGYEDGFGSCDWYPTYALYIDDQLWLHCNVCRFHYSVVHDYWQPDYVLYTQEKMHLLTGEQVVEKTLVKYSGARVYAPAVNYDVYRHRVLPDSRLQVEHSVLENERSVDAPPWEETESGNWDEPGCKELSYRRSKWSANECYTGRAESDYFRATSKSRYVEGGTGYDSFEQVCTPMPGGGERGGPPYTWTTKVTAEKSGSVDFTSEIKDYFLSGFEVVEEAGGSMSWSCGGWWLDVLRKDPPNNVYEHTVSWDDRGSGGGDSDCEASVNWPDKARMCNVECEPATVSGEDYHESGSETWYSYMDEPPILPYEEGEKLLYRCGYSIWGLPLWAVCFVRYGVFLPYRHALCKSLFHAFYAVNGKIEVKMLEKYAEDGFTISELSVRVNDEWDATAAFIKELERVTRKKFNVQLLYGIFAYVRAKDEQGLSS